MLVWVMMRFLRSPDLLINKIMTIRDFEYSLLVLLKKKNSLKILTVTFNFVLRALQCEYKK